MGRKSARAVMYARRPPVSALRRVVGKHAGSAHLLTLLSSLPIPTQIHLIPISSAQRFVFVTKQSGVPAVAIKQLKTT